MPRAARPQPIRLAPPPATRSCIGETRQTVPESRISWPLLEPRGQAECNALGGRRLKHREIDEVSPQPRPLPTANVAKYDGRRPSASRAANDLVRQIPTVR